MFVGHTLTEFVELGRRILRMWDDCRGKRSMHRVAIIFFRSESLVGQLVEFNKGGRELFYFPDLFMFVLKYSILIVVGHYLKGRHRQIFAPRQRLGQSYSPRW